MVSKIVEEDQRFQHMPDYAVSLEADDMVVFRNRGSVPDSAEDAKGTFAGSLQMETYNDARIVAPGWDVYYLEKEWRAWITEAPRDADSAFIGFCRKWYERRGTP